MQDLRADVSLPGEAVIVDARTVKGCGAVVDVIVRWGTLKVGDYVVAGACSRPGPRPACLQTCVPCLVCYLHSPRTGLEHGRIKALQTDAFAAASANAAVIASRSGAATRVGALEVENVEAAVPGQPVRIIGFKGLPLAGDDVLVVESEERARDVTEGRARRADLRERMKTLSSDAAYVAAQRAVYLENRRRIEAYEAAVSRARRRAGFAKAGIPAPPELALQVSGNLSASVKENERGGWVSPAREACVACDF
jgi:hypothetical protein